MLSEGGSKGKAEALALGSAGCSVLSVLGATLRLVQPRRKDGNFHLACFPPRDGFAGDPLPSPAPSRRAAEEAQPVLSLISSGVSGSSASRRPPALIYTTQRLLTARRL